MCGMKNHSQYSTIDVVRRTTAILDVLDGGPELSEKWNGFTQCTVSNEKPPDGLEAAQREEDNARKGAFTSSIQIHGVQGHHE